MRFMKKGIAIALAATMVIACAPANGVSAAKKPSVAKKASVEVGKTTTIKVKNSNKKAKVTWKTSKKTVAKITKAVKKGVKASATVKGIKEGKAKITATYKLGKKSTKLTCTVTVKKATVATQTPAANTQAPVVSPSASAAPSKAPEGTTKPTKTPRPTKTPSPVPTATPTAIPVDASVTFDAVSGGALRIDNSTYNCASGNSKYLADKDYVEVNDPQDQTHGSWNMPAGVSVGLDDIVEVRVQGFFKGTQIVRFWIGTEGSGGCTPIELCKTLEEGREMGDHEYPACYEEDGTEITKAKGEDTNGKTKLNQILLGADPETGKFDTTFKLKIGTSQNDAGTDFSKFTLKGVIGNNIDGLVVKNIYIVSVNGKPAAGESGGETGGATEPDPNEPAGLDLTTIEYNTNGSTKKVNEDGSVTFTKEGGFPGIFVPLPDTCSTDDEFNVKVVYECVGSSQTARAYLIKDTDTAVSNRLNEAEKKKGSFEGVLKATGEANIMYIKADAYNTSFDSLTIKKIILEKVVK